MDTTKTDTKAPEMRRIRMHANYAVQSMKYQSGSLEKGALEAIMNSVDKGATEIVITLSQNEMTFQDNGVGFKTR